ncbi:hypothetical protein LCGC14_0925750 [marine sediment metagenome]|uniref:Uncharacterized protein n=1 Tax=marine sediment metagenome TaxID=412755 RepID=A0A0F9NPI5_9ZZZZ
MRITKSQAIRVGNKLGVDWKKVDIKEFTMGMNVELEHKDVTEGSYEKTGKIVLAHLREWDDYYSRLKVMEKGSR